MAKNYMVMIYEKKKPLFRGVSFLGGETKFEVNLFGMLGRHTAKKWFFLEPGGVPTLDSPSLFHSLRLQFFSNLFRFILKLKLLPS
jgi:hypothetical protein